MGTLKTIIGEDTPESILGKILGIFDSGLGLRILCASPFLATVIYSEILIRRLLGNLLLQLKRGILSLTIIHTC